MAGADTAQSYREGFLEGAKAVLRAIGDDLPEQQMRVLQRWVDGPLTDWRQADAEAQRPTLPMLDGA